MTLVAILLVSLPLFAQVAPEQDLGPMMGAQEPQVPTIDEDFASEVIAIVNGEEISMGYFDDLIIQDLVAHMSQADPALGDLLYNSEAGQEFLKEYTRNIFDDFLIQIVLAQEIEEAGIEITEAEKQEYFEEIDMQLEMMQQQGISQQDLLGYYGYATIAEFKEGMFEDQLLLMKYEKLLEEKFGEPEVSEDEAREMFEANPAQFQGIDPEASFDEVKDQVINRLQEMALMERGQEYLQEMVEDAEVEMEI